MALQKNNDLTSQRKICEGVKTLKEGRTYFYDGRSGGSSTVKCAVVKVLID
jgi:hypothetical protein